MSQSELVIRLAESLPRAGVRFMVTGSMVSSIQGAPRSSHDIDIVAEIGLVHVPRLLKEFPAPEFFLDEFAVRDAIKSRRMFNILPSAEPDKIDVWLLKDDEYDRTRFERRQFASLLGVQVPVSAPEDTILYKLRWSSLCGGSEKQFLDVLRVFELQYRRLDFAYIDRWAARLGVQELLERVRREANPL